jgi:hypothetical protein
MSGPLAGRRETVTGAARGDVVALTSLPQQRDRTDREDLREG